MSSFSGRAPRARRSPCASAIQILASSAGLLGCAPGRPALAPQAAAPGLTIELAVPPDTPDTARIHVAGTFNRWNPGDPAWVLGRRSDGHRVITLPDSVRGPIEFKFTLGSWETVELDSAGSGVSNRGHVIPASGAATWRGAVARWRDGSPAAPLPSTARASVIVLDTAFEIAPLGRKRRVWLYLPPDYATSGKTYPVIYMHDGQNVFDQATSFAGEWGVDETLDSLHAVGDWGAIVVAVDHGGPRRFDEYSPWRHPKHGGGQGDAYVDFLARTLKPWIDRRYRTRPDRLNTAVMGSSMGGLISLYAMLKHPDVFGRAGIFSPAFWVAPDFFPFARTAPPARPDPRIYFVVGGREAVAAEEAAVYVADQRRMVDTLIAAGFRNGEEIRAVVRPEGRHTESFWRQEFAAAYRWLFPIPASTPAARGTQPRESLTVASPDGLNRLTIELREGRLFYHVRRRGQPIIQPSALGFLFRGARALGDSLRIVGSARATFDTTWTQPWGEVANVRDHHNELRVTVAETVAPRRHFTIAARAFDDGVAFRYEVADSGGFRDFEMMEELTEFSFADNARAWWIPANDPEPDRQELLYSSGPVSRLDTVHTPLTLQTTGGVQVVIHEANLVDYAGMYLARTGDRRLRSTLARWRDGVAVRGRAPFVTPWRTIQLADRVGDLAPSVLGLKLNPPSRIANTSWIRPMKYNGIWWSLHINLETWFAGPKHGATTANTKRYIDFAAANGMGGTLVEGWNTGWELPWFESGKSNFSFTQSYPDFDLADVAAYARTKGMTLIGHHETATAIDTYERQLDSAMALYQRVGVRAVKTGYVGDTTEHGHAHQSQFMVRHHRRVIETAARHEIAVNVHEPIKDTGERRTWPNMLSREGARGQEYNAWAGDGGNPPEHETILFFTRLLAGPMDFTPGIFDLRIKRPTGTPRTPQEARPRTTLAKQLALYVVLYSPLQMAADVIENYQGQPAFQFIRDVAVDWDATRVIDGAIGDYVVVARKTRGKDEWFLGAITDEEARTFTVPLSFLPAGRRYVAEIYADGPGASWRDEPERIAISSRPVTSVSRLRVALAPGGGQAIRFRPAR